MRRTLTLVALAALASAVLATAPEAIAQTRTKNGSGSSAGAAATADKPMATEAPVGHRQPRAADLPSNADDPMHLNADDAALDKQIKSICKGC